MIAPDVKIPLHRGDSSWHKAFWSSHPHTAIDYLRSRWCICMHRYTYIHMPGKSQPKLLLICHLLLGGIVGHPLEPSSPSPAKSCTLMTPTSPEGLKKKEPSDPELRIIFFLGGKIGKKNAPPQSDPSHQEEKCTSTWKTLTECKNLFF